MSKSEDEKNTENVSVPLPDKAILRAVALKYEPEKSNAPRVVAAGSGFMAQRILELAAQNDIAIYHDDSAATLLSKLDLGKEIPPELYQIVVNIYIYLLTLANSKK